MHEQNIIYGKIHLDDTMHERTVIFRQLYIFRSHAGLLAKENKRKTYKEYLWAGQLLNELK